MSGLKYIGDSSPGTSLIYTGNLLFLFKKVLILGFTSEDTLKNTETLISLSII
jgi:hypothetical protein